MPPMVKNGGDTNGVKNMGGWINSLQAGPGVALTAPASSVVGDFSVTVTFTVPVTGLTSNEFTVSNGAIISLTGSGANYSLTISPGTPGQVNIQLPAGQVQDASGHPNYPSNPLSVTLLPGPTLLHRWSFNGDANDSISGSNATPVGTAVVANNQLQLPGGGPFANYASVNIGSALRTNASLTVETWMTINTLTTWSKVWMFGVNNAGGEPALSYIDFTPLTGPGPPKVDFDPSVTGEMNTLGGTDPARLVTGHQYHVVVTFEATRNLMSLYLDGALADSASMGGYNITQLGFDTGHFGSGFYFGDPDFNGSINELRIYSGSLSPQDVANNYAAGPDTVVPPGTKGTSAPPVIIAFSGNGTNYFGSSGQTFSLVASGPAPLTYQWTHAGTNLPGQTASSLFIPKPSVANVGTYQVTISNAGGNTSSPPASLTLLLPPPKHRSSFAALTASITASNAILVGNAALSGGQLQLPGGGTFANYASVNLAGTLASNPSISVETWVTLSALQNWSKVWMFGANAGGEPVLSYINFTPRTGLAGNPPKLDFDSSVDIEFNTTGGANPPALVASHQYHAVAVFDSCFNLMSLYLDGAPADSASMGGYNIEQLGFNTGRFGCGYYFPDPDLAGSINELRVYAGVLTTNDALNNFNTGPDTLVPIIPTPQNNIAVAMA